MQSPSPVAGPSLLHMAHCEGCCRVSKISSQRSSSTAAAFGLQHIKLGRSPRLTTGQERQPDLRPLPPLKAWCPESAGSWLRCRDRSTPESMAHAASLSTRHLAGTDLRRPTAARLVALLGACWPLQQERPAEQSTEAPVSSLARVSPHAKSFTTCNEEPLWRRMTVAKTG